MNAQKLRYKMCRDIEKFISEKLAEFTKETGLIVYPNMEVCSIPAYIDETDGIPLLEDDVNGGLFYNVLFDVEISDAFGSCPRRGDVTQEEWDYAGNDSEKRVVERRRTQKGG